MATPIATFFYVGYMRPASGTWGSAAAIPVAYLIHVAGGYPLLIAATLAVFFAGWWATAAHIGQSDNHDPSEVVIDEVAGQWVALIPVSVGLGMAGVDPWTFPWPGWVSAFFLFRLFDIWKPGPAGWADRRNDPLGVMLDDIFAGIFAGICVLALAGLSHGLMGQ
ncbi:MAG: phosphatidylglycerophosphatase A [Rhodobacteraceae bacterium]|nr:phosphatidylglycerophosphatase A [Paracoccaceae bacterium]